MSDKKMNFFERYLTAWVLLCIGVGILVGKFFQAQIAPLADWNVYGVNVPVAILIWAMIYPMMLQVDFSSLAKVGKNKKGLGLTVVVNWLIKPFSMAFFAWLFFKHLYAAYISPELAEQYIAGAILLGAAPCTAMVFVWSYLTDGDANYTLVQVSVNDIILMFAFIPLVQLLLGITSVVIPWEVLASSVVTFVAIPLVAGYLSHRWIMKRKGEEWFKQSFLPRLRPISIIALLTTLVLIFAFQGDVITSDPWAIVLIAVPLTLQTYLIFFLSWFAGRFLKLRHAVCAPAAMIGASNFFELAVAVAIVLFGLNSGAVLVTVVGVLIEVPVMLSLVKLANKWKY